MRSVLSALRILGLAATIAVAALGRADVPYGEAFSIQRNVKLYARISLGGPFGPLAGPNTKVSFTKVDVSFTGQAVDEVYEGTEDPYTGAKFIRIRAKIATSKLQQWVFNPGATPGTLDSKTGAGRFASTTFVHGAGVLLWMDATFRLYHGTTYTEVTVPVTATVQCYNRQLTFGTTIGGGLFGLPTYEVETTEFSQRARTKLSNVKHNPISTADMLDKPEIATHLGTLTVLTACTHGGPGGFCDSYGPDLSDITHSFDWSEVMVGVSVLTRTVPPPNLVLMYSCDTLGASAAAAFGIHPTSVDKGYVGFEEKVMAWLVPGNDDPDLTMEDVCYTPQGAVDIKGHLYQHMEAVFSLMENFGENAKLELAVTTANSAFPPRGLVADSPNFLDWSCPVRLANYVGNGVTTTKRVFLTTAEEFMVPSGVIIQWYYFFH